MDQATLRDRDEACDESSINPTLGRGGRKGCGMCRTGLNQVELVDITFFDVCTER